jgi:hypothetical protein
VTHVLRQSGGNLEIRNSILENGHHCHSSAHYFKRVHRLLNVQSFVDLSCVPKMVQQHSGPLQ